MSVKIAFIGSGGIASAHVDVLQKIPEVELVAFADIDEMRARRLAEQTGGNAFTNYVEMLEQTEVDAVYICLPPFAHGEPEKACLSRRLPFFVEKPLAADMETATDILGMINRQHAMTAVGYQHRYRRSLQRGRELLRGATITTIEAHMISGTPGTPWWSKKHLSGGQLVEQSTHLVDAIVYLAGRVVEVYAVSAKGTHAAPPEGYDIEDATSVTLRFASGAIGSVNSACTVNVGGGVGIDVYGPSESLSYRGWQLDLTATKSRLETEFVSGDEDVIETQARAFIKAVETGDPSLIRCDYGRAFHAHQITMAANQSLETGMPVKIGT